MKKRKRGVADPEKKEGGTLGHFLHFFAGSERRDQAFNVLLILVLGFSLTLLMTLYLSPIPQGITAGSLALKDIKADRNYEIVDEKTTEALRQEAAGVVPPIYDFDMAIEKEISGRIGEAFERARNFLTQNLPPVPASQSLSEGLEAQLKGDFVAGLGIPLTDEEYRLYREQRFPVSLERALKHLVHSLMEKPVFFQQSEIDALPGKSFVLRKLLPEGEAEEDPAADLKKFVELDSARKLLAAISQRGVEGGLNIQFLSRSNFQIVKATAASFLRANTEYNGVETEARRQQARTNVKNNIIKLVRGELIIRDGTRFEPWHLTVIDGIRKERMRTSQSSRFVGTFLFVNLVLFIVYFYASRYIRKFKPGRKDVVFLGLSLLTFLLILRVGGFVGSTLKDALPFSNLIGSNTLTYVIPVAAGAMMVRFILNSETALIFAVLVSLFSGVFLENSLELTVYYLISSVYAAHAIAHVDKRSSVLLGGIYTGLVNAVAILSLNLISVISISSRSDPLLNGVDMIAGFFGGIFTAMTVLVLTPVMEGLFNYTTDIKLLELANLSHPLLKEMIVRAPGTYHHSQMVGVLAEAAAQSIGANPLLARVASYYHDIGKMQKPRYFIENQAGDNPHEKLAPSMSALIIEAHVKDGLELAREHKLPKKIADMIPQHQGTKLMGFFYSKAKKQEDLSQGKVNPRDFRYTGPKPQSREAGVIMLSDAVEASVRALPEKTPAKIEVMVEKIVNHHFVDEQLDECDLTLRDLHRITGAFIKILIGIYHQRVEYPEGALVGDSDAGSSVQSSSPVSNIAPLFPKKDQENPSSSQKL